MTRLDGRNMEGLTGFLFGNVDESGRLESDVFDDEEKKQLEGLSTLGMNNILCKLDEEGRTGMVVEDYAIPPPSPMAVDYSNISDNEAIDEDPFDNRRENDIILPSLLPSSSLDNESIESKDDKKDMDGGMSGMNNPTKTQKAKHNLLI